MPTVPEPAPRMLPGFWQHALGPAPARAPLTGDVDADVCIVGAGFTGLWAAWSLLGADPSLKVVVIEAESVGFGASGRNGGWLSALMPGNRSKMAAGPGGGEAVLAFQRQLVSAVQAVVDFCTEAGIEAGLHLGGVLTVATNAAQEARLRAALREDSGWGVERVWLAEPAAARRVRVAGARAATWDPHCARLQPAALVRGLASAVEARGGAVYERTCASAAQAGVVALTGGHVVRAPWVVVATEGYTGHLAPRRLLPMNSSMIVTRPLPAAVWAEIGWAGAETLADAAHAYVYLQRTADDRIAIGGRGVPYRYASTVDPAGACPPATVHALEARLLKLFPVLGSRAVTGLPVEALVETAWSGVLGVARDWCPSITVARSGTGGLIRAGGYVGDGVTMSHLAGRTIADLISGRDSELTRLPWVGWPSRRWEPEPLRWLGIRTVYGLYRAADRAEARRPERSSMPARARLADWLAGR